MAYDDTSFWGDMIVDEYDEKNNLMNPVSPTGYLFYHLIGGGFDAMSDMCSTFLNDCSVLSCEASSLDKFWGVSYSLPRPLLYKGIHRAYLFEDACTSTDNKSEGYVLNTGSYSFDSDGLVIESEPTNVWFTDDGTSASHYDHWYINSYGTATVQDDGTKLLNTSGTGNFVMRSIIPSDKTITESDSYSYNPPYIVEFDIVETDGTSSSNAQVQIYSSQTTDNFAQGVTTGHYRIEVTSEEQKIWVDDTLIKTTNLSLPNARITLRVRNRKYLIYKNFRVFENYQANLRLDNNVYTVPFEVSFDLLNDGNDTFRCYFYNTSFSNSAFTSATVWTKPNGQTTKIRFVVTEDGITRYINDTPTTLNLNQDVAEKVGVRFGYWQTTQSSIKIKNYKVYRGEDKERPLNDKEYRIYLYLRNCRLMTREDIEINMNKCFAVEGYEIFLTPETHYLETVDHAHYAADESISSNIRKNNTDTSKHYITNHESDDDTETFESLLSTVQESETIVNIPPNSWNREFLDLLEQYISIKGNLRIKESLK